MNRIRRKVDSNIVNPPSVRQVGGARFTVALSLFDIPEAYSQEAVGGRTIFGFDYPSGPEKTATDRISGSADIVYGLSTGRIREVRVESGLLPSDTLRLAAAALETFRENRPDTKSHSDVAVRRILGDRNI